MTEIISRKSASEAGLSKYYTGKPCANGHIAERWVPSRMCCECSKKWQKNNRALVTARVAEWRSRNRADVNARAKAIRAANPEKHAAADRKWRHAHPERANAKYSTRRAAKLKRVPAWFDEFDSFVIKEAAALAKERQRTTGIKWHIDHMIPLRARMASGLHCAANIQVIPEHLNIKKLNRMVMTAPGEWVRHG